MKSLTGAEIDVDEDLLETFNDESLFLDTLLCSKEERSQSFKDLSKLPLMILFPSGVKATLYTLSRWPRRESSKIPEETSHIRITESRLPAATMEPSGEMDTEVTPASWFWGLDAPAVDEGVGAVSMVIIRHDASLKSQTRMVSSPDPETIYRPSLEKSSEYISCSWPSKTCRRRFLAISQTCPYKTKQKGSSQLININNGHQKRKKDKL